MPFRYTQARRPVKERAPAGRSDRPCRPRRGYEKNVSVRLDKSAGERRTKVETMEFFMSRITFATASNYAAAGFYSWYFFAYFTEACGRGRC